MLSAAPGLPCQMAFHEQTVNIVIRIPFAALVDRFRAFSEGQGGHAVILRDNDIPAPAEIDQGDVHRVSAGTDDFDRTVIGCQLMTGIAKQSNRDTVLPGDILRDPGHRACIRVNINRRILLPLQKLSGEMPYIMILFRFGSRSFYQVSG